MIVYIIPYLDSYGGIQTFAKDTFKSLKNKQDINIINWKLNFPNSKLKKIFNVFPWLYKIFINLNTSPKKKVFLKKADLIHFWHPLAAVGFEKSNLIISCHGKEILPVNLEIYEKRALIEVFDRAKLIHVNSKFTKKLILKLYPFILSNKIRIIYPGVNLKNIKNINRKNKKEIVIGTLSRFNPRKNIVNIINALSILKKKYKVNFKYLLVGKGIEEKKILNQLKRVNFKWQYWSSLSERKKANKFYSQLDIFVLPTLSLNSDVEGFGIVYLEANSYGIPVVASKVDGVREVVKGGISGVFTNPKNPKKIAQSIYQLILSREKYQQPTRQWAKNFSLEKTAMEFNRLYESCL